MSVLTRSANPYFNKVSYSGKSIDEESATLAGIALKVFYFLSMTGVGVAVYMLNFISEKYMVYALIGAGGIGIISALISFLIPSITPVTGTLFCLSQGFSSRFCMCRLCFIL